MSVQHLEEKIAGDLKWNRIEGIPDFPLANFEEYSKLYYIVLGFIFIVVIAQIPKQNRDLEADFKDSWKQYLKEE